MELSSKKPEVLAIIPARGGSKGLPRKNIRKLCGKPLIAYSIEVALKSTLVDRVIVSTEDEEIAEISKDYEAEVPFLRPKEMAEDRSSIGKAIDFTIQELRGQGYFPNILVTLYPTTPFRTPALIDLLVGKLIEENCQVNTVKRITHNKLSIFSKKESEKIIPLLRSQRSNGGLTRKVFFRQYGLFLGSNHGCNGKPYLHVIKDPISLIDIDSLTDFNLAAEIIKQGLFNFDLT